METICFNLFFTHTNAHTAGIFDERFSGMTWQEVLVFDVIVYGGLVYFWGEPVQMSIDNEWDKLIMVVSSILGQCVCAWFCILDK